MKYKTILLVWIFLLFPNLQAENWPQFRGPNGGGLAQDSPGVPVEFGPTNKALWKLKLPAGHSSPAVWGSRIFITAFEKEGQRLLVLAVDRPTGKVLWERQVAATEIEKVHSISSPATATPVVDGERVYVYFGSAGLFAFDLAGNPVWSHPLPMSKAAFGSGTSPVLAGELLILSRDEGREPFLLALNRKTGAQVWKVMQGTERRPYGFGHSTPAVHDGVIVIHRQGEVAAFDLNTGARKWSADAMTQGNCTPVVGGGAVYVGTWMNSGEPDLRVPYPTFAEVVSRGDKNGDGMIEESEFPDDIATTRRIDLDGVEGASMKMGKWAIRNADQDKNGKVTATEWDALIAKWGQFTRDHGVIAVKLGGEGDVTKTHVLWRETKNVPEIPAPLYYEDRLFTVTNGGIMTCLNATTGEVVFRGRLGAGGGYFSSPVAVNGKVYFASQPGVVSVIDARAASLSVLARNDFGEEIFATPAIVDGKIYVRTAEHLYAIGEEMQPISKARRPVRAKSSRR